MLLSPLSQLAYIPASVPVGSGIGLSAGEIGLTVGAHSLAIAAGNLVFGPMLDGVPVRRVLPVALTLFAATSTVLALHQTLASLLAGRAVQGLCVAVVVLCAYVTIADAGRDSEAARDRELSLMQSFMSVGAAGGVLLGGLLVAAATPDGVFVVMAGYGTALLVATGAVLRKGEAAAVVPGQRPTLGGVLGFVAERRMRWLLASSVVLGLTIQGSHFSLSTVVNAAPGTGSMTDALVYVMIPMGVFAGSLANRWLLRRFERGALYPLVYGLVPLGGLGYVGALAVLGPDVTAGYATFALGFGLGATMPLAVALGVGWHPRIRATATSADQLARQLGATAGPVVVGAVATISALSVASLAIALIGLFGLAAALVASRTDRLAPSRV